MPDRGADDFVGLFGQIAAVFDQRGLQAGIDAMLGCVGFVLCLEVEELSLGEDANGGERFFFEHTDGHFRARDVLLDQRPAVFRDDGLDRLIGVSFTSAGALQRNTSMLLPLSIALTTHEPGIGGWPFT